MKFIGKLKRFVKVLALSLVLFVNFSFRSRIGISACVDVPEASLELDSNSCSAKLFELLDEHTVLPSLLMPCVVDFIPAAAPVSSSIVTVGS